MQFMSPKDMRTPGVDDKTEEEQGQEKAMLNSVTSSLRWLGLMHSMGIAADPAHLMKLKVKSGSGTSKEAKDICDGILFMGMQILQQKYFEPGIWSWLLVVSGRGRN